MTFLLKEAIDAGYEVEEIVPGILLIKNFITDDELKQYMELINSLTEEDWNKEYLAHMKQFCMEKFGRDDVENLIAEGKYEVTQGWEDKNYKISHIEFARKVNMRLAKLIHLADSSLEFKGFSVFQRMQEGVQLKAHTDQHTDPSIQYAAVAYINEDYLDGEIFWPNKDISLRPPAKSVLVFSGNDEFNHGVKHVGKGPIRYVLPGFIKITDWYEHHKY